MRRIFKIIGKTVLGIFGTIFGILFLCFAVTLIWSVAQINKGTLTATLPTAPDSFVPAIRFVVFTDTHNQNDRVADMMDTAYALYENNKKYAGIDAFFGLGDFSSIGTREDYDAFVDTLNTHVKGQTKVINILGNHEAKNKDSISLFTEEFGYEPDTATEINGFSFICLSSYPHITEWTYPVSSLKWADSELIKAEAKVSSKPIFVMQHPHNFGTVYGSTIWCDPQLNPIWAGHNKVVNFSGHSHFPMNDPRSINQTTYTSVGVGGMARFELDKNYLVGQHPQGYDTAAQFCIVEADNDGRVRILAYDLNSDTFFQDYFIENVNRPETYAYTYKNLKSHDAPPVFAENTAAACVKNENGEWVLSFNDAADNYIVHDYKIKITDESGKTILNDTYVNDYYVIDGKNTADFSLGENILESGKTYTARITAVNAFHQKSEPIELQFTAQG